MKVNSAKHKMIKKSSCNEPKYYEIRRQIHKEYMLSSCNSPQNKNSLINEKNGNSLSNAISKYLEMTNKWNQIKNSASTYFTSNKSQYDNNIINLKESSLFNINLKNSNLTNNNATSNNNEARNLLNKQMENLKGDSGEIQITLDESEISSHQQKEQIPVSSKLYSFKLIINETEDHITNSVQNNKLLGLREKYSNDDKIGHNNFLQQEEDVNGSTGTESEEVINFPSKFMSKYENQYSQKVNSSDSSNLNNIRAFHNYILHDNFEEKQYKNKDVSNVDYLLESSKKIKIISSVKDQKKLKKAFEKKDEKISNDENKRKLNLQFIKVKKSKDNSSKNSSFNYSSGNLQKGKQKSYIDSIRQKFSNIFKATDLSQSFQTENENYFKVKVNHNSTILGKCFDPILSKLDQRIKYI